MRGIFVRVFDIALSALTIVFDLGIEAHDLVPVIFNRHLGLGQLGCEVLSLILSCGFVLRGLLRLLGISFLLIEAGLFRLIVLRVKLISLCCHKNSPGNGLSENYNATKCVGYFWLFKADVRILAVRSTVGIILSYAIRVGPITPSTPTTSSFTV